MWIERCLYRKQYEEPQTSVTNTPFRQFPIAGFEDLTICSTGFQGIDLPHMTKAVRLMGATYDEFLSPKASVLLCKVIAPGNEKLPYAQIWGIPAVKPEWLWDCIRRGESIPFAPYLIQPLRDPNRVSRNSDAPTPQDTCAKSRKPEKSQEKPDRVSTRPTKIALPPKGKDTQLEKRTPSSSEQVHIFEPGPWSITAAKPSGVDENRLPELKSTNDITTTAHTNLDDESSHTLRPTSGPLHEISPNHSQTKRSASPEKLPQPPASAEQMPSPQKPDSTSSSLRPAISSLLAHHQRVSASSSSEQPPRSYRRRRQLLGRAPSNLSSHSINLSRASSVDTMNTDGLGTPLEPAHLTKSDNNQTNNGNHINRTTNTTNTNKAAAAAAEFKTIWSAHQDDPDREEPPLQLTQLGYEDETVKAWRERGDSKMGVGYGKGRGKGTPGKGKAREVAAGGLGISTRTRLATGR